MSISLATGIPVVTAASELPFPPASWANVPHWRGVYLEFDLEMWADEAASCSGLELFGAVVTAVALDDDDVDAVVHADDELTVTGHDYATGDGPVRFTTSGTLPAGLSLATDYWLGVVDDNTVQVYASLAAVLAGADPVAITSAGSGTHTISDTADTKRVRWLSHGLLGKDADGAVTLSEQRGYATRIAHRPRALAYAIAGTISANISATIYLTRTTKV
jgi:hypothetical protein